MWLLNLKNPIRFDICGDHAVFRRYSGKEESVVLPEEFEGLPVTEIADNAFYDCSCVRWVVLPQSVTKIGMNAFRGCENLESIRLPEGLLSMGEGVFCGCEQLKSVRVPEGVEVIAQNAFSKCIRLTHIQLPERVREIEDGAFSGCSALEALDLGSTLKKIGENVFKGCAESLRVVFPESFEGFTEKMLTGCECVYIRADGGLMLRYYMGHKMQIALDNECCGKKVVALGPHVFEMFSYLKEISLPKELVRIGENCFRGCSGLKSISLPETLTEIEAGAFFMQGLEQQKRHMGEDTGLLSLRIPKSVRKIGSYAFGGHVHMKNVVLEGPVEEMGTGVFAGCGMESFVFPEGMTEVQTEMFGHCLELVSVTLPESLEAIWEFAFARCPRLKDLIIPENVQVIAEGAFFSDSSLTEITIPTAVNKIGEEAFADCSSLAQFIVSRDNPFFRVADGLLIHEPSHTLIAVAPAALPLSVTVPDDVQAIGASAFYNVQSLQKIVWPKGLKRVGEMAFADCKDLRTIKFEGKVSNMAENAFTGCIKMLESELSILSDFPKDI